VLGDLGTDNDGFTLSFPEDINNFGIVVGYANKYGNGVDLGTRAVRWDPTGSAAIELGNLGTDAIGKTLSRAEAINSSGTIVGGATKYVSGTSKGGRAVRWNAGGTDAIELGLLGTDNSGTTVSGAAAINDAGIVVGIANEYDNLGALLGRRAVMWGADGLAINLNTLIDPASGWVLTEATSISSDNWISGRGSFDPDGTGSIAAYNRLFLIQVPEPASAMALMIGVMLLRNRRIRTR